VPLRAPAVADRARRGWSGRHHLPATLKLNPNLAHGGSLGSSFATGIVGNDLVCQFAPISFDSFRSVHPPGCPPRSANAATSGGSGVWNFGPPGSSNVVKFSGHATLIWRRSIRGSVLPTPGCAYAELTPTVVAVWQAAPKNTTCTVNASNRSQFDCVLPACLQSLQGSSIPTAAFSPPGPGYTNDFRDHQRRKWTARRRSCLGQSDEERDGNLRFQFRDIYLGRRAGQRQHAPGRRDHLLLRRAAFPKRRQDPRGDDHGRLHGVVRLALNGGAHTAR
jgi:hypothetical protein